MLNIFNLSVSSPVVSWTCDFSDGFLVHTGFGLYVYRTCVWIKFSLILSITVSTCTSGNLDVISWGWEKWSKWIGSTLSTKWGSGEDAFGLLWVVTGDKQGQCVLFLCSKWSATFLNSVKWKNLLQTLKWQSNSDLHGRRCCLSSTSWVLFPVCYMLPLYVSRQSVHRLFVILAQGLMFQYGNCTGIVLNRHKADGLGVWAISGDDMHWKLWNILKR